MKQYIYSHIVLFTLLTGCSSATPSPSASIPPASQASASPAPVAPKIAPPQRVTPQPSTSPPEFCAFVVFKTNQLKGRITDHKQVPLAGVSVNLSYLESALTSSLTAQNPAGCERQKEPSPQSVTTDANGYYVFPAVVIGPKISLTLNKAGYSPLSDSFVISQAKDPQALNTDQPLYVPHQRDFQLTPDCPLSAIETAVLNAQILAPDGSPLSDAKVQVSMLSFDRENNPETLCNPVKYEFEGKSNALGDILLTELVPARYTVTVTHPKYPSWQEVLTISFSKTENPPRYRFQLKSGGSSL